MTEDDVEECGSAGICAKHISARQRAIELADRQARDLTALRTAHRTLQEGFEPLIGDLLRLPFYGNVKGESVQDYVIKKLRALLAASQEPKLQEENADQSRVDSQ